MMVDVRVVLAILIGGFIIWHFVRGKLSGKPRVGFETIKDRYETLQQVQAALRGAGLESSQLMIGIDFTRSNESSGALSFQGRCLHDTSAGLNPYQEVVTIIGNTLSAFDDDGLIPAYGFGDVETTNTGVFPLGPQPCNGFEELLTRYARMAPTINMSGPTSFVPIIKKAIDYVKKQKQYTILLIIADGQVTDEKQTEEAIIEASKYPISIVVCGVGDGPFDLMEKWDDELPKRKFDNVQFVNFTKIRALQSRYKEATFATAALQEIPEQYKAIQRLGYI